jgi:D-alanyl-D-alanine carboxypeptidase
MRSSDITPTVLLAGSVEAGTDSVVVSGSNKYPSLSCAWQYNQYLNQNGVSTACSIRMILPNIDPPAENLTFVAEWKSPCLTDIVYVTNHISNNFYAETIEEFR